VRSPIIDPDAPTQEELIEHNTKIAKVNFAVEVVKALAGNPATTSIDGRNMALIAIDAAETLFNTYPMVPLGRNKPQTSLTQ